MSNATPDSLSAEPDRFTALPLELWSAVYEPIWPERLMLYYCVEAGTVRSYRVRDCFKQHNKQPLLDVSRQIRIDVLSTCLQLDRLEIGIFACTHELPIAVKWISDILDMFGPGGFGTSRCLQTYIPDGQ